MKVGIYKAEIYPVFTIDDEIGFDVEIPNELYKRYLKAKKLYDEVQSELAKYYEPIDKKQEEELRQEGIKEANQWIQEHGGKLGGQG